MSDEDFLTELNEAMIERPLDLTNEDDRKRYVQIYDPSDPEADPVALLTNQIKRARSSSSAHLFSGFRGSGKSTELRRLQNKLQFLGYRVVYVDLDGYLDAYTPVGVGDYLLTLAGAFDDELHRLKLAKGVSVWKKASGWLSKWEFEEIGLTADAKVVKVDLKASLRDNPEFRQRLRQHLDRRLEVVVKAVHDEIGAQAAKLADASTGTGIVLLIDSTEKLSDTDDTNHAVRSSVRVLFAQNARRLRFPGVHAVYSVPPDLTVLEPQALSTNYEGRVPSLTAVTVENKGGGRNERGVALLLEVLQRRHREIARLISDPVQLDRLVLASGGNLRNLLFLVRSVVERTFNLPVAARTIDGAIKGMADDFRYLTSDENAWLQELTKQQWPRLATDDDRRRFSEFLERQVVLPYRNGTEWYDVTPPVRELLL